MKNRHTAISILAGLVLSENLFAQSATGPTAGMETQLTSTDVGVAKTAVDFNLTNSQKTIVNSLKNNFSEISRNINISTNQTADANTIASIGDTNLSGQCVTYVKNVRPELDFIWGNARGGANAAREQGFHVDTIPRVGAAFIRTDGNFSTYGHTGIVTKVDVIKKYDGSLVYSIEISDANRSWNGTYKTNEQGKQVTTDGVIRTAMWEYPFPDSGISFIHEEEDEYNRKLNKIKELLGSLYENGFLIKKSSSGKEFSKDFYLNDPRLLNRMLVLLGTGNKNIYNNFIDLTVAYKEQFGRSADLGGLITYTEFILSGDSINDIIGIWENGVEWKNAQSEKNNLTDDASTCNSSCNNLDVTNTIKVTETQNNANSLSSHAPYWSGLYTKNYYSENNLGQPSPSGFGDGPAETREQRPGPGTNLYLLDPQNHSVDKTISLSGSQSQYFGNYDYVAWGAWSDASGANKVYASHWVVVDKVELDRGQAPRSGTARYEGSVQGTLWTIGQDNSYHNANGDITLNVNFGDRDAPNSNNAVIPARGVTGVINVFNADTQQPFARATFNTTMDRASDGLTFQGTLTGDGYVLSSQASDIRGDFGGNQAAEVGGAWSITTMSGQQVQDQATGVFRATKQ